MRQDRRRRGKKQYLGGWNIVGKCLQKPDFSLTHPRKFRQRDYFKTVHLEGLIFLYQAKF
jgi:hypothetical protein